MGIVWTDSIQIPARSDIFVDTSIRDQMLKNSL